MCVPVTVCQTSRRHVLKDCNLDGHGCQNLKYNKFAFLIILKLCEVSGFRCGVVVEASSCGMLRDVSWRSVTDLSGQHIRNIFFDCLTLENGAVIVSRNVDNQLPTYAV
jgi:hypothetical protein